ncbi:MAG: hypothetical protein ACFFD7_02415 [Candidatus Thorarchaeota archaeon]
MNKKKIKRVQISILSIFVFIIIWQVIASLQISTIIPTPFEVLKAFIDFSIQGDNFGYNFLITYLLAY